MLYVTILVAVALAAVQGAPQQQLKVLNSRIINGTDAELGQYPHQVSLQVDRSHFCGGFIITKDWVVSACHCVEGLVPSDLTIVAGTVLLSEGGVRKQVTQIIPHENYQPYNNWWNDISLSKVSTPFEFNNVIQPIPLPSQEAEVPARTPVYVTGWGTLEYGGDLPDHLQVVNIQTFSDEECRDILSDTIYDSQICAGLPEGNKGECNGDSGGALVAGDTAVGIVSWSYKPCTKPPYPSGVYTQVSYYIDWIQQNIN